MRQARFDDLLETYGAAIERWPEADQAPARRLLEQSAAARAARERALALDAALDADRVSVDAATLLRMRTAIRERAARTAPGRRRAGLRDVLRTAPALRLAALAAAAIASIWIGWATANAPHPSLVAMLEGNPFLGERQ
jgi:endonuclease/exonuclease/phosphatase (EEP) superfamily protein YafD